MQVELVSALENAASPVPNQRKIGENNIKLLEKNTNFYVALLHIYANDQVSMSSRYLAIIYLKNAIDQKWRKPSFSNSEEKDIIRSQLLPCLLSSATVSSRQMTKQVAVIIASIARIDFPRQWPNLLLDLNQRIIESANSGNLDTLEAALEAMHQSLKKLATARIGQARIQFNDFSTSQIELYWQIYMTFNSYSALKIVGTLLYDGHDRSHQFPGPKLVFHGLFEALQLKKDDAKVVRRIGKIYERLVERHPHVFCGFKDDAALVVHFYCDFLGSRPSPSDVGSAPIVQSMCIIRDITRLVKTESRPESSLPLNLRPRDENDRQNLRDAYVMCGSVFTETNIGRIVDALIQFYFQMSAEDVELWQDDPSEFVVEESRQNAEFSVVLCAEMLFAHILKAWPEFVAPRAQNLIEQAVQSGEELKVEGALRALEFGASTFSQSFDIEPIIQLVSSQSSSPFIRRRLCLVVGGWIPVREGDQLPKMAFELVNSTLNGNWDVVVQLGALELTRICCDDIDFQPELFSIVANSVFAVIYKFLETPLQTTEVKLQVLKVLGTVIEGLGPKMTAINTAQVYEILPALWTSETEHSNHHLIQGAVLHTISNLISACGSNSTLSIDKSYSVALPLVDVATDPSQPLSAYLLDDGLSVWKALLVNSPEDTISSLAPLFDRLVQLIETKTEELGSLLSILESYLWLDFTVVIPYSNKLFGLFALYLSDGCALDEALLIMLCIEITVMLAANHASKNQLLESMQNTGLLQWMENCVIRAGSEDVEMDFVIQAGKCLIVLSLVSIETSGHAMLNPQALFPVWIDKIRGVSNPRDRKLGCMGVTAMLLSHPELFNQYSSEYIQSMALVIEDIPDTASYTQFYNASNQSNDELTVEERRQLAARCDEIAVRVGLQSFIKEVAQHLQQIGFSDFGMIATQMGLINP